MKRGLALGVAGAGAVLLLGAGIAHVLRLCFRASDSYPAYSSLRCDPLGTKAFFDSLAACSGLQVERTFRPLAEPTVAAANAVLFYLGDDFPGRPSREPVPRSLVDDLDGFLRAGGRVVLTLRPRVTVPEGMEPPTDGKPAPASPPKAPDKARAARGQSRGGRPDASAGVSLTKWLGTGLASRPLTGKATGRRVLHRPELPDEIACRSVLGFADAAPAWQVVYARDGMPVLMERAVGRGSLVLSSESFVVSNEGLRDAREPALLLWLLDGRTRVVFDETHLGLHESPGVAALVRRYGLGWMVLVLLALAGLFVWKHGTSLVPVESRPAGSASADRALGKESARGLLSLLQRHVPEAALLPACVEIWKKTADRSGPRADEHVRRLEALLAAAGQRGAGARGLADMYNSLCAVAGEEHRPASSAGQEGQDGHGQA